MGTTTEALHAARLTIDTDTDPSVIVTAAKQTIHDGNFAARLSDSLACGGVIVTGAPGCIIEGQPAARVTDSISHGSVVMTGTSKVVIGNVGGGAVRNGVALGSNSILRTQPTPAVAMLSEESPSIPSAPSPPVTPATTEPAPEVTSTPTVSGGQRNVNVWQWGGKDKAEIEALRNELLERQDLGRVQRSLHKFGLDVSRQHLHEVKKYNFDSPGLIFSKENYDAWNRLAWGIGTVADAQYLVHELREVEELRKIQQETGFDFMGRKLDKMSTREKRKWEDDFLQFYLQAHRKALEQEYSFLSEKVRELTNNRLNFSRTVVASSDPNRLEARKEMIIDGFRLEDHPQFLNWHQIGFEEVEIGTSSRKLLNLPLHGRVRVQYIIEAVKKFRPEKD